MDSNVPVWFTFLFALLTYGVGFADGIVWQKTKELNGEEDREER